MRSAARGKRSWGRALIAAACLAGSAVAVAVAVVVTDGTATAGAAIAGESITDGIREILVHALVPISDGHLQEGAYLRALIVRVLERLLSAYPHAFVSLHACGSAPLGLDAV